MMWWCGGNNRKSNTSASYTTLLVATFSNPLRYCPAKRMKMMDDESILLDLLACSYDEKEWLVHHSLRIIFE